MPSIKAKNKTPKKQISLHKTILFALVFCLIGVSTLLIMNAQTPPVNLPNTAGILFSSKQGSETQQIWKMNLDGSQKVKLTNDNTSEHEWSRPSPDGKKILFTKASKGSSVNFASESNSLWTMDTDGSNQKAIIDYAKRDRYKWKGIAHAEWSPDSTKIVLAAPLYDYTSQLFVVDSEGNKPEQITNIVKIDNQNTVVSDPSWSNDNQIMFIRGWQCFGLCDFQDVFKLNYQTRQEVRVTNDPQWNYDPYISPDGSKYIWLSFRDKFKLLPTDLMQGNTSGALNPRPVIADEGTNANGTFSPDSKKILFLKTIWFKQVLHLINSDGTGLTKLAPTDAGESGIASFIPTSSTTPVQQPNSTPTSNNSTNPNTTTNTSTNTSTNNGTTPSPNTPVSQTEDSTPPTTPTNLQPNLRFDVFKFKYFMDLTWQPSIDVSGIREYKILRDNRLIGVTTKNSFTDTSLATDINFSYNYSVHATDNSFNANMSKATTVQANGSCILIFCGLK